MVYEPTEPVIPYRRGCPFDPAPEYSALRSEQPISPLTFNVAPLDHDGWLVTRFDDARSILSDSRFSHRPELLALVHWPPFPPPADYRTPPAAPGHFGGMDSPQHSRYRRLLTGFFTVRRIREFEPTLERLFDEILDDMAGMPRPVDLVSTFARPLTNRATCLTLGLQEEELADVEEHFDVIMSIDYTGEEFYHHSSSLTVKLASMIARRFGGEPGPGMFGQLIAGGELTEEEMFNIAWTAIAGALDTTPNMLALGTWALLEHPDQLAALRERPDQADAAIEELLRYLTISHFGASRVALEDVKVRDTTIKGGQTVVLALGAANRDPAFFEHPETLDVTRPPARHLAFGFGIHQCLGQHLARATLRIGYRKLFERFPTLRLAVPADSIRVRDTAMHYGVVELPVTWDDVP